MATLFATTLLAAEGEHVARPLPMPPELYGIIGVVLVFLLLIFTWLFRHTSPPKAHGVGVGHGPAHTTEHGSEQSAGAGHGGHH
ncbi:hypothetical protein BJY21_000467 [Kineosphaera limosa]|uniref:Uncharacterized protein n=1 Tax=Kineosphaera limosa NBRC 100340 TaxID=1184609 RepID=K6VLH1_9MICO|nr:hypothetical protein [Kineosphaera limosa]NYD99282.1 hypothetical protein [Kineosphaera limosa]GAB97068.1 hypothetical protein KILIM_055_00360 [Kineosphaera limosa NBRC 100340]